MATNNESSAILSEKTVRNAEWRWIFFSQIGWNYEKMQGSGYCYAMLPALREMYSDDDDYWTAVQNHLQFFNTTPAMGDLILGINLAVEPEVGIEGQEVVSGIKTGLMGPFAGVGDSIFGVTIPTIMGSISAYMALDGNPLGVILWIIVNVLIVTVLRPLLFRFGYSQGRNAINVITDNMKPITNAASILGLTVVGALMCTTVSVSTSATFVMGELEMTVQEMLDSVMPGLLSILSVVLIYLLLDKKNMTSTKAIWIVVAVGLVLGALGIIA